MHAKLKMIVIDGIFLSVSLLKLKLLECRRKLCSEGYQEKKKADKISRVSLTSNLTCYHPRVKKYRSVLRARHICSDLCCTREHSIKSSEPSDNVA